METRNLLSSSHLFISGTASVALAGVIGSLRITNNKIADHTFVFLGAGEVRVTMCAMSILHTTGVPHISQ